MPDSKTILDGTNLINGSVTEEKLAANAVTNTKIKNGSVTAAKIATNTITSTQLANAAVNNGAIQSFAVTEEKIAAGAVSSAKLAPGAVTAAKIANKALSYDKLNFTKVYSKDHTFTSGARSGFHYPDFLTREQYFQPFKWKWVVTLLDIASTNKNVYIRNCSHLDNTVETGVFWFEYYYSSVGYILPAVLVDNRAGASVSVRVELYRWD